MTATTAGARPRLRPRRPDVGRAAPSVLAAAAVLTLLVLAALTAGRIRPLSGVDLDAILGTAVAGAPVRH